MSLSVGGGCVLLWLPCHCLAADVVAVVVVMLLLLLHFLPHEI
jgi:hypothetical protein